MKKVLHIINSSPFNNQSLAQCLDRFSENDSIILIGDGVYAALDSHPQTDRLRSIKHCYALQEDINTRGINCNNIIETISLIDDKDFVALSVEHPLSQSWF